MRYATFSILIAGLCPSHGHGQPTNFSGIWRWNPAKTQHGGTPPEDMRVKIDQNGSDITIVLRIRTKALEEFVTERIRVGADDNKNEIHGATMISKAAWDGATLAVDSVAKFGDKELRLNDRWSLSPDKQTLTMQEHHQFGSEPAADDIIVFDRQTDAVWEPPQPPKPAEQVYKNIQVMKGVPAPRLMSAMQFFTKSLGVECAYCHVPKEFEKDDKPAKNTARKMLNMVHDINGANFPNNQVISCWMCHRGSAKPEAFPK